jgi:mono/diheme cytochrome c family protein
MAHSRTAKVRQISLVILITWAVWSHAPLGAALPDSTQTGKSSGAKREAGLAAWQQVYSVLTHPRCINCHTATNYKVEKMGNADQPGEE